jgi:hypothetical protein
MRIRTAIRAKRIIRDFGCLVGSFVVIVIAIITEGGQGSENPKLQGVAIFLHCMIVLLAGLEFVLCVLDRGTLASTGQYREEGRTF